MSSSRRQFLHAALPCLAASPVFGALACSRPAPSSERRAEPSPWEAKIAALEQKIRQSMAARHVPGASVVVIRDGAVAWSKGLGTRDAAAGTPVDENTVFSAQSMSKPVFAYRVMKLCDEGILDLDAPLTRYTHERFVPDDPRLDAITARRVLSHTTGLPNWRSKEEPLRINFTPGSKWSYSGEGYHYLQSIVTRLTGHTDRNHCATFELDFRVCATDFGEYMEANVLRPFGMPRSGYVPTPAMEANLAVAHDNSGKPQPSPRSTAVQVARYGSAGSLMTTARDFAAFIIEIMQPKPPDDYRLTAATRREMLRPQIAVEDAPVKASWALGWQIWHLDQGDIVAHGGDIEGWHAESMFSPERKTGFVIMTNGEGGAQMIWTDLLMPLMADFVLA